MSERIATCKLLHVIGYALIIGLALLLTACGRDRETPTPIPASVVRPVQPPPIYGQSTIFRLTTPNATGTEQPPGVTPASPPPATTPVLMPTLTPAPLLPLQQNPSALGIAARGATLLSQPGGSALATLPVGATATVTGRSADGRYLAAYLEDGQAGWIRVEQLTLFGADDLIVVAESTGPGAVATLLADAMQPVQVLDSLLITPTATASR